MMNILLSPEHSHLFAAIGSALNHNENVRINISDLHEQLVKGCPECLWKSSV